MGLFDKKACTMADPEVANKKQASDSAKELLYKLKKCDFGSYLLGDDLQLEEDFRSNLTDLYNFLDILMPIKTKQCMTTEERDNAKLKNKLHDMQKQIREINLKIKGIQNSQNTNNGSKFPLPEVPLTDCNFDWISFARSQFRKNCLDAIKGHRDTYIKLYSSPCRDAEVIDVALCSMIRFIPRKLASGTIIDGRILQSRNEESYYPAKVDCGLSDTRYAYVKVKGAICFQQ